ncbi:MAG TPA: protein kinase, partial [Chloroflexota bacterium]|nr:protein kinase [Chloroflexota bacterium]
MNVCVRCGLSHPAAPSCPVGSALPAQRHAALSPGTILGGRFRIEAVAHRSGMSTVYRAADQRSQGAPVALKEFHSGCLPDAERDEALVWLAREAALLSTLANPRLPRLIAAFSEGDRHYVAMPFLSGETLEERVAREGPQPETVVLALGRDLAGLLRYLHAQDPPVVHRDLKPA